MKSRPQQVGHLLVGRLGDGGADPAAQPQPGDAVLAHHPGDPLVVDPRHAAAAPSLSSAVIRGAPWVRSSLVDVPDPLGQLARPRPPAAARAGAAVEPGVERGPGDLDDLAQPLHLEGVPVVGDELEAAHQFVSPAKYLAAWRRMSRSVASLAFSATSSRSASPAPPPAPATRPARPRADPPAPAPRPCPVRPGRDAATGAWRRPSAVLAVRV